MRGERLIGLLVLFIGIVAVCQMPAQGQGVKKPTSIKIVEKKQKGKTDEFKLGYAVPVPQNDPDPGMNKYRTYSAILARLGQLEKSPNGIVTRFSIGKSRLDQDVWALKITAPQATRDDGSPKPAVLLNGTIHPREWISPETVLRIAENLIGNYKKGAESGYPEFLVNNCEINIVVVSNPDSFVYTQTNYDKYMDYPPKNDDKASGSPPNERDGRMRRKNQRDRILAMGMASFANAGKIKAGGAFYDGLLGVDLNRNFSVGFGNPNHQLNVSDNPPDITYRGPAAFSEPETKNLQKLVMQTIGPAKLRGFIDYHSYGQNITLPLAQSVNPRNITQTRDKITVNLRTQIRDAIDRANGASYNIDIGDPYVTQPKGKENGAFDEFVGNLPRLPPAYTLELPPTPPPPQPGREVKGFVPPENIIAPTAKGNIPGAKTLVDFAIGPPYLRKVIIWMDDNGNGKLTDAKKRYQGEWETKDQTRELKKSFTDRWVTAGTARFLLVFDRPMKQVGPDGKPVEIDGKTPAKDPKVVFKQMDREKAEEHTVKSPASGSGWLGKKFDAKTGEVGYDLYQFDTWQGEITIPAGQSDKYDAKKVQLIVDAMDLLGDRLDGDPKTILDWNKGWVKYEASPGGQDGEGGSDKNHVFQIDTKPPNGRR